MTQTSRQCPPANRPCHRLCRWNLWWDTSSGTLRESKVYGNRNVTCLHRIIEANPDGLSVREIAAILGLTEGYVDLVVRRALLKLRDNPMVRELSGEDPGPTYQEGFGED